MSSAIAATCASRPGQLSSSRSKAGIGLGQRPVGLGHRAIMLGEALERFPAEVKPVEVRHRASRAGSRGAGCGRCGRSRRRRPAPRSARPRRHGRTADGRGRGRGTSASVRSSLRPSARAMVRPICATSMAVGQADAEMVAVGGDEHLGLVAQAAEGDRMDDPVAVALEDVARAARPLSCSGWARPRDRSGCAARSRASVIRSLSFLIVWPGGLVQLNASTRTLSRSSTKILASETLLNGPISSRDRSGASAT